MKPCAHVEALEAYALAQSSTGGDAWLVQGAEGDAGLEAHVAGCGECSAELDRLLEERALFVRRASAMAAALDAEAPSDFGGVLAELDRRHARVQRFFEKAGAMASLVAAAAACVAVALVSARAAGAHAEPDLPDLGATAIYEDEPMSRGIAACVSTESASACNAPAELPRATRMTTLTMSAATAASCEPDMTCSSATP